jgi:rubrerythrin
MWLAVAGPDLPAAAAALRADWERHAGPEERRAAAHVVDHDADAVTCPACGFTFPTGPAECPDCGLGLR